MALMTCRCGTMEVHEHFMATNPDYARAQARAQEAAIRYRTLPAEQRLTQQVTIPVVVHVVLKDPTLVTDEQVRSQIGVLNEDYNMRNADLRKAPPVFLKVAANPNIRFVLATIDPQGNPTTGIIRKTTTVEDFSTDNSVKHEDTGGANAWPRDKYFNVWVCPLGGGVLGYAQFPGGQTKPMAWSFTPRPSAPRARRLRPSILAGR